jgi:serine/threonine protein kinase
MNPEQWSRVKELFHAALAQDERTRGTFIASAAADDPLVRAEVERLLEADRNTADFIEHPAVEGLLTGRILGHYEVGRLLGAGGMGRVYAARDLELGREVALKIAAVESDEAQTRLRREAQHASRLSHPHICHVYEVGTAEARVFVVMELVPGPSLADVLRAGPLPAAAAKRYGMDVADALAHAHEQGVTHRDLKSTNVIITPKRGAVVLDFGLARMLDGHRIDLLSQSQRSLTADGMLAGTLSYMPPELLRGQRGDQRADVWALGVLLYEMVTGQRPFTGATGFELSAAILHQPPGALPSELPEELRVVISRCLEKDPADRYQHAGDVHRAFEEMPAATVRRPRLFNLRRAVVVALLAMVGIGLAVALTVFYRSRSGDFSNNRGYSLLGSGKFDDAVDEFEGVANQNPEDANAWDSLGEGYLASGLPDQALGSYSHALTIRPRFSSSLIGRSLALAALGRYDEALAAPPPDPLVHAWLLSRAGRYRAAQAILDEQEREALKDDESEDAAGDSLVSAWLRIEQHQYAQALEAIHTAESALGVPESSTRPLFVVADLLAVVADIRAGRIDDAITRQAVTTARADPDERIELNWAATAAGEIALAQGSYDGAMASFTAAQSPAWQTLGQTALAMFALNLAPRDGPARVALARGNRRAAIEQYRRLTGAVGTVTSGAMLEPREVLALARLLDQQGDGRGARTEYQRFLRLWSSADADLPELAEARNAVARLSAP